MDALLDRLRTAPVPVQTVDGTCAIVDYATTRQVIFSGLYRPHTLGAQLAQSLAELEHGNGSGVYAASRRHEVDQLLTCSGACGPGAPLPFDTVEEANTAIACGDVKDTNRTLDELVEIYKRMSEMSPFAELWSRPTLCS